MLTTLLVLVGVGTMVGGVVWAAIRVSRYFRVKFGSEQGSRLRVADVVTLPRFPSLLAPVVVFLVGLIWTLGISTGSTHINGTDAAVVENTITGEFTTLGPGTHIFPVQPKLIPFVTKVTKYTLRRSNVEVGAPDDGKTFLQEKAVEADSNSPGRPPVFFWARVWAYPNRDMLVELHKRYGSDYLHNWIERVYIAALKSVQGKNEYFYVGQKRVEFQHDVEQALQAQLLDAEAVPIVHVQQLAVVNFAFSEPTNQFLQTVQKVEFDRQQAEQQVEVNKKHQEGEKIAVETSYIVETRNAQRDRDARISRAEGEAQGVRLAADAEAYRIAQTYTAEAEGIKKIQQTLAAAPAGYLEYQKTRQWDGELPQYILGDGIIPFFDLAPNKEEKKK